LSEKSKSGGDARENAGKSGGDEALVSMKTLNFPAATTTTIERKRKFDIQT